MVGVHLANRNEYTVLAYEDVLHIATRVAADVYPERGLYHSPPAALAFLLHADNLSSCHTAANPRHPAHIRPSRAQREPQRSAAPRARAERVHSKGSTMTPGHRSVLAGRSLTRHCLAIAPASAASLSMTTKAVRGLLRVPRAGTDGCKRSQRPDRGVRGATHRTA
jgi:hypothetical protein